MSDTFPDLDRRAQRRLLARTAARTLAVAVGLLVVYFTIPTADLSEGSALLVLLAGLVAAVGLLGWQVRSVVAAPYPTLRAVEALGTVGPLLVLCFALVYASVSQADPAHFSESMSRIGALYFAMTVLTTVGFGDIVPRSDAARLLVTGQMLVDVVLIGVLLRVLTQAARMGIERRRQAVEDPDAPPGPVG